MAWIYLTVAGLFEVGFAAYGFSGFRRIVDVGGGNGALLVGILRDSSSPSSPSSLKGTLFDVPQVVERARLDCTRSVLPAKRWEATSLWRCLAAAMPTAQACHSRLGRRSCGCNLRNCRKAMSASAKLLIIEGVYPPRVDQSDSSRGAAPTTSTCWCAR